MRGSLSVVDSAILLFYLVLLVAVGSFFYRKDASISDFFFAGSGMAWIPVCVSIIASSISAITFMGTPAFVFRRDLETLPMVMMLPFVVLPVVSRYFAPFYHRLRLGTAYEYLEVRFDLRVRILASFLFLLLRGFYMGIVIYAPSLVLSVAAGLPLVPSILAMGLFTTIYTALGGMRAVVWTDMMQFAVLVLGIGCIMTVAHGGIVGGWPAAYHLVQAADKTKLFDFRFNLDREFTVWSVAFGSVFFILSTFATDQIIIQRYMTARSIADCRRAIHLQAILLIPLTLCLQLLGLLLAAFYLQHPGSALGMPSLDAVVPFFIRQQLPTGIRGVVIASIFAAAMGAMSGGINSLTTATVIDFYKRIFRPEADDRQCVGVARRTTVFWGLTATGIALFAGRMGELANLFNKANSFVGGVILWIFLIGIFTSRPNGNDTLLGAGAGLASVISLALFTHVTWLFFGLVGCGMTFLVACASSRLWRSEFVAKPELLMNWKSTCREVAE